MKKEIAKTRVIRTAFQVLLALISISAESSCSHAQDNKEKVVATQTGNVFTLPDIPQVLTTVGERADYLVSHYWDHFDFTDTTRISRPEITEQAFVDFLDILPHVPVEKSKEALSALMDSASAENAMFIHFMGLAEKYLYDPNSPFCDEELYIPVLHNIISSSRLDRIHKVRPEHQLEMAMKNRPGSVATDFSYTDPTGTVARMSSLKADYTLLFFNNPDCRDCKRAKEFIKRSEVFSRLAQAGSIPKLCILAVYPDADLSLWRRADYPGIMVNSYDAGRAITNKELYDLKAIPTFYLLDKEKRVILKDAPIERVEKYMMSSHGTKD